MKIVKIFVVGIGAVLLMGFPFGNHFRATQGRVVGADKKPLKGVEVSATYSCMSGLLESRVTERKDFHTVTDDEGRFETDSHTFFSLRSYNCWKKFYASIFIPECRDVSGARFSTCVEKSISLASNTSYGDPDAGPSTEKVEIVIKKKGWLRCQGWLPSSVKKVTNPEALGNIDEILAAAKACVAGHNHQGVDIAIAADGTFAGTLTCNHHADNRSANSCLLRWLKANRKLPKAAEPYLAILKK